jgi:hypothetical protein
VGNAASHLTQSAEALLLHHSLLCLPQIIIGFLQRCIELRLMRGKRDVFAQMLQELTFAAAEACPRLASGDKDTEDFVVD